VDHINTELHGSGHMCPEPGCLLSWTGEPASQQQALLLFNPASSAWWHYAAASYFSKKLLQQIRKPFP